MVAKLAPERDPQLGRPGSECGSRASIARFRGGAGMFLPRTSRAARVSVESVPMFDIEDMVLVVCPGSPRFL